MTNNINNEIFINTSNVQGLGIENKAPIDESVHNVEIKKTLIKTANGYYILSAEFIAWNGNYRCHISSDVLNCGSLGVDSMYMLSTNFVNGERDWANINTSRYLSEIANATNDFSYPMFRSFLFDESAYVFLPSKQRSKYTELVIFSYNSTEKGLNNPPVYVKSKLLNIRYEKLASRIGMDEFSLYAWNAGSDFMGSSKQLYRIGTASNGDIIVQCKPIMSSIVDIVWSNNENIKTALLYDTDSKFYLVNRTDILQNSYGDNCGNHVTTGNLERNDVLFQSFGNELEIGKEFMPYYTKNGSVIAIYKSDCILQVVNLLSKTVHQNCDRQNITSDLLPVFISEKADGSFTIFAMTENCSLSGIGEHCLLEVFDLHSKVYNLSYSNGLDKDLTLYTFLDKILGYIKTETHVSSSDEMLSKNITSSVIEPSNNSSITSDLLATMIDVINNPNSTDHVLSIDVNYGTTLPVSATATASISHNYTTTDLWIAGMENRSESEYVGNTTHPWIAGMENRSNSKYVGNTTYPWIAGVENRSDSGYVSNTTHNIIYRDNSTRNFINTTQGGVDQTNSAVFSTWMTVGFCIFPFIALALIAYCIFCYTKRRNVAIKNSLQVEEGRGDEAWIPLSSNESSYRRLDVIDGDEAMIEGVTIEGVTISSMTTYSPLETNLSAAI